MWVKEILILRLALGKKTPHYKQLVSKSGPVSQLGRKLWAIPDREETMGYPDREKTMGYPR